RSHAGRRTLTRAKIPNPTSQAPNPKSQGWGLGFGIWVLGFELRRRHLIAIAAALAGAALFTYAVRRAGVAEIVEAVRRVGWGLVLILVIAGLRFLVRAQC